MIQFTSQFIFNNKTFYLQKEVQNNDKHGRKVRSGPRKPLRAVIYGNFQVPVKVTGAKVKCTLKWIDISFYWMSCRTHPSLSCKISRQNIKPRFSGTDEHSLYLRLLFRLPPDVIPFFNGKQTLEKEGLQYSTPGGTVTAKWACDWVHTMTSACLCSLRAIIDIIYNNRYK